MRARASIRLFRGDSESNSWNRASEPEEMLRIPLRVVLDFLRRIPHDLGRFIDSHYFSLFQQVEQVKE